MRKDIGKPAYTEDFYSPCMGKFVTKHFISYPARNNWKYENGDSVAMKDSGLNFWLRWEYDNYMANKRKSLLAKEIKEKFTQNK